MKANYTRFVLSITLTSALFLLITGCNRQQETSTPPAPSTTVGTKIDDSVVTARVKSALLADPNIKSFDIAVVTRKGEVQLSGFIDNQTQIDRAIEIAHGVDGVHSVTNKMSIKQ
jgi:hyperosmotically inducible periplasmic protein